MHLQQHTTGGRLQHTRRAFSAPRRMRGQEHVPSTVTGVQDTALLLLLLLQNFLPPFPHPLAHCDTLLAALQLPQSE